MPDTTPPGADFTHSAVRNVTPPGGANTPPRFPIPQATLLAVSRGVLAALGFPGWVEPTRITQLTLTRQAATVDWLDDDGGSHHVTIAVAP